MKAAGGASPVPVLPRERVSTPSPDAVAHPRPSVRLRYGSHASEGAHHARRQTQHRHHLGRRHRPVEHQLLHDGLMGYRTPNIDRIAKEGMMLHRLLRRAELHRRPGVVHHRPAACCRTGLTKVGLPGATSAGPPRKTRPSPSCSSRSATPPASSARTTSATATSSCRPCTASTSSTATSTTSTPRKSRSSPTIRRTRPSAHEVRPARRARLQGHRRGRPDRRPAVRQGRQADDQGHRPADQEADGDDRRRHRRPRRRLHQAAARRPTSRSSSGCNFTHMHFRTHVKPESKGQSGRWQSEYHDAMIDHDKNVGTVLDALDDLGHRRQHVRHVLAPTTART